MVFIIGVCFNTSSHSFLSKGLSAFSLKNNTLSAGAKIGNPSTKVNEEKEGIYEHNKYIYHEYV